MFPSEYNIELFKQEFGAESIVIRSAIPRQSFCGTQAAVVIIPRSTKEATLTYAWGLVRAIARWILSHASELPANERIIIIVGWSQSVRKLQGQIFKVGGDFATIQTIANTASWSECQYGPLFKWEKDVFQNHKNIQSSPTNQP